jgi:hypothetical protein
VLAYQFRLSGQFDVRAARPCEILGCGVANPADQPGSGVRLEDSLSPDRPEEGEGSTGLEDLEILGAAAGNDRRLARTGSGRLVSVRPVPTAVTPTTSTDVASALGTVERLRSGCVAPHLMPVAGAAEQDGRLWIATELDQGVSLRRLLAVTNLTPAQASFIGLEILAGLVELHRLGLCHTRLHHGNVHIDVCGKVRLTDWALASITGEQPLEARQRTDVQSLAPLVRRLQRAASGAARGRPSAPDDVLEQLRELVTGDWDDVETLAHEVAQRTGARPDAGTCAAIAVQLGELSTALGGRATDELPRVSAPLPHTASTPSRWVRTRSAAPRRPRRRTRSRVLAACCLLVVALAALAVWRGGIGSEVRRLPAPSLSLPSSPPPTSRPAPATDHGAVPAPAPGLRPVPSLGPSAAGPVSSIDLQSAQPDCGAGASCPVRVTVRLTPEPQAQIVAWTLDLFDRCTGTHTTVPGGSVTALAEWPYVYGTTWVQLPAGHPVALIAVSSSPARVASQPFLLAGTRPC